MSSVAKTGTTTSGRFFAFGLLDLCTMALLYDLKAFDRESGNESNAYFDMRVNEGESKPKTASRCGK